MSRPITNEKGGQLDRKLRRNWYKMENIHAKSLKHVYIRPPLWAYISGTKCDWHKLIFSAERRGQSDLVVPYNRDQIRSTITKMVVMTAEPSYNA